MATTRKGRSKATAPSTPFPATPAAGRAQSTRKSTRHNPSPSGLMSLSPPRRKPRAKKTKESKPSPDPATGRVPVVFKFPENSAETSTSNGQTDNANGTPNTPKTGIKFVDQPTEEEEMALAVSRPSRIPLTSSPSRKVQSPAVASPLREELNSDSAPSHEGAASSSSQQQSLRKAQSPAMPSPLREVLTSDSGPSSGAAASPSSSQQQSSRKAQSPAVPSPLREVRTSDCAPSRGAAISSPQQPSPSISTADPTADPSDLLPQAHASPSPATYQSRSRPIPLEILHAHTQQTLWEAGLQDEHAREPRLVSGGHPFFAEPPSPDTFKDVDPALQDGPKAESSRVWRNSIRGYTEPDYENPNGEDMHDFERDEIRQQRGEDYRKLKALGHDIRSRNRASPDRETTLVYPDPFLVALGHEKYRGELVTANEVALVSTVLDKYREDPEFFVDYFQDMDRYQNGMKAAQRARRRSMLPAHPLSIAAQQLAKSNRKWSAPKSAPRKRARSVADEEPTAKRHQTNHASALVTQGTQTDHDKENSEPADASSQTAADASPQTHTPPRQADSPPPLQRAPPPPRTPSPQRNRAPRTPVHQEPANGHQDAPHTAPAVLNRANLEPATWRASIANFASKIYSPFRAGGTRGTAVGAQNGANDVATGDREMGNQSAPTGAATASSAADNTSNTDGDVTMNDMSQPSIPSDSSPHQSPNTTASSTSGLQTVVLPNGEEVGVFNPSPAPQRRKSSSFAQDGSAWYSAPLKRRNEDNIEERQHKRAKIPVAESAQQQHRPYPSRQSKRVIKRHVVWADHAGRKLCEMQSLKPYLSPGEAPPPLRAPIQQSPSVLADAKKLAPVTSAGFGRLSDGGFGFADDMSDYSSDEEDAEDEEARRQRERQEQQKLKEQSKYLPKSPSRLRETTIMSPIQERNAAASSSSVPDSSSSVVASSSSVAASSSVVVASSLSDNSQALVEHVPAEINKLDDILRRYLPPIQDEELDISLSQRIQNALNDMEGLPSNYAKSVMNLPTWALLELARRIEADDNTSNWLYTFLNSVLNDAEEMWDEDTAMEATLQQLLSVMENDTEEEEL